MTQSKTYATTKVVGDREMSFFHVFLANEDCINTFFFYILCNVLVKALLYPEIITVNTFPLHSWTHA